MVILRRFLFLAAFFGVYTTAAICGEKDEVSTGGNETAIPLQVEEIKLTLPYRSGLDDMRDQHTFTNDGLPKRYHLLSKAASKSGAQLTIALTTLAVAAFGYHAWRFATVQSLIPPSFFLMRYAVALVGAGIFVQSKLRENLHESIEFEIYESLAIGYRTGPGGLKGFCSNVLRGIGRGFTD